MWPKAKKNRHKRKKICMKTIKREQNTQQKRKTIPTDSGERKCEHMKRAQELCGKQDI